MTITVLITISVFKRVNNIYFTHIWNRSIYITHYCNKQHQSVQICKSQQISKKILLGQVTLWSYYFDHFLTWQESQEWAIICVLLVLCLSYKIFIPNDYRTCRIKDQSQAPAMTNHKYHYTLVTDIAHHPL